MTFLHNNPAIITPNAKLVTRYTFDASLGTVEIKHPYSTFLLVVNVTQDTTLYNPLASIGGVDGGNGVLSVDLDTTSMDDSDILLIVVDAPIERNERILLNNILEELKTQTLLLQSITET
jgi:hypothetical protein